MSAPVSQTRRGLLAGGAALLGAQALPVRLFAAVPANIPVHGLSAFGELKYPADFAHFDYVNVDAPKGGEMRLTPWNWFYNQSTQTFNTLNSFVAKGDAPPRMELCFDSLMEEALDEPDAIYGLVAETVEISEDRNRYTFRLRPEARWHDGTPLTAHDCAFAFTTFKLKGEPTLQLALINMTEARALDDHTLELEFDGKQSERAILAAAIMPIISKAWYETHPFDSSSLEVPLSSGPYRPGRVNAGNSITYERVADYWGRDLPVNRGVYNFDRIRVDFYRERLAGFEAFKKGDVEFRLEYTSKTWATEYNFPALSEGKVVKREFPEELRPKMQAWAFNQRRARFADKRVRQAIALCFDFEWTRENFFYGSYERSQSIFENSEFRTEGMPSAEELAIMEPMRDILPPESFGEVFTHTSSDGSGRDRAKLREAGQLMAEAGWTRKGATLINENGETFTLEFLVNSEVFIRVYSPFMENLKAIGIQADLRLVDPAQYQSRLRDYDFDLMGMALQFTATPTRTSFDNLLSSHAADLPGTYNMPGIKSEAVDRLVQMVGDAKSRAELVTAMRVLDRVLRARFDWVPTWHAGSHRAAYWDKFGFVEPKPDYGFPVETLWWEDAEKAARLAKG